MPISCRTCRKKVAESAVVCPKCGDIDCVYNVDREENQNEIDKYSNIRNISLGLIGCLWVGAIYGGVDDYPILIGMSAVLLGIAAAIYFGKERDLDKKRDEIMTKYWQLKSDED